jgi:hypothetical protein
MHASSIYSNHCALNDSNVIQNKKWILGTNESGIKLNHGYLIPLLYIPGLLDTRTKQNRHTAKYPQQEK